MSLSTSNHGLIVLVLVIWGSWATAQTDPYSCPGCDLQGHDFSGQDLTNANFAHANLDQANFTGATLKGARFDHASLRMAHFGKATCGDSDRGPTSFVDADLTLAQFPETILGTSRFEFARLTHTHFESVDLRKSVFGLSLELEGHGGRGKPVLKKAKLGCELAWAWPLLHTEETPNPECDNTSAVAATRTIADGVQVYRPQPNEVSASLMGGGAKPTTGNHIHVIPNRGKDATGCGSQNNPCKTIHYGLSQGQSSYSDGFDLLLAYDTYSITDQNIAIDGNISIHGGYWNGQSTNYQSLMDFCLPADYSTFISVNAAGTVGYSNLIITGCRDTTGFGSSAQSLIQFISTIDLTLGWLDLTSVSRGTGGPGAAGAAVTQAPSGVIEGLDSLGGAGGQSAAGVNASGGRGAPERWVANQSCTSQPGGCQLHIGPAPVGLPAQPGAPGGTGQVAAAGGNGGPGLVFPGNSTTQPFTIKPTNGTNGQDGATATAGGDPGGYNENTTGTFAYRGDVIWQPARGGGGLLGAAGGGGGGGGSGGFNLVCTNCANPEPISGGAGGGGGAGGYGGNPGGGGGMGAAAIGMILYGSQARVNGPVTITGGQGGTGGPGGNASAGGQGGFFSMGVGSSGQAGDGGHGGNGGWGAPGGGGAGGNGGASLNLVQNSSAIISGEIMHYLGVSGTPGTFGFGGTAQPGQSSNNGQPGLKGAVKAVYDFD